MPCATMPRCRQACESLSEGGRRTPRNWISIWNGTVNSGNSGREEIEP